MSARILILDEYAATYAEAIRQAVPGVTVESAHTLADVPSDLPGVDALVAFGIAVDDSIFRRFPDLKWIQSLATGVDHFLRLPSMRSDILLTSTRGIHGPQMREMVVFQMLALGHRIARLTANNAAHKWQRYPRDLLWRRTAAIVGLGVSGIAIGQLLSAFGMRVIGVTRTLRDIKGFDASLPTGQIARAAAEADYLINVLPGSPENANLFDRDIFAAMKPTAYFINVGRGETVDEEALLEALRTNRIAGAAVDVFRGGALSPDSPFWELPNLLITPHVAGFCTDYEEQATAIIIENLRHFLEGDIARMRNVIPH